MDEQNKTPDDGPAIVVAGEGGFDLGTLTQLTEAEGDDTSDNDAPEALSGLENDPDVPKAILEDDGSDDDTDGEDVTDVKDAKDVTDKDVEDVKEPADAKDDGGLLTITHNGKQYKVPKSGEVELPVDGKKEKFTFQEVLNRASGNTHIERTTSELGRREKRFKEIETGFNQRVQQIEADLTALRDLDDPYEICEYVAALQNKDATEVFETMVKNTVNFLERRAKMTPEQVEVERENRRLKMQVKKSETAERLRNEESLRAQKQVELDEELQEYEFSREDFSAAIEEIRSRLAEGEEMDLGLDKDEPITKDTIIDYMIAKDLNNRVETAINSVNSELKDNPEFMREVVRAITLAESLTGKLSEAELKKVVQVRLEQTKKATGESLSKKARERSKSEPANFSEQDEDDEGIDVSNVADYFAAIRNI